MISFLPLASYSAPRTVSKAAAQGSGPCVTKETNTGLLVQTLRPYGGLLITGVMN